MGGSSGGPAVHPAWLVPRRLFLTAQSTLGRPPAQVSKGPDVKSSPSRSLPSSVRPLPKEGESYLSVRIILVQVHQRDRLPGAQCHPAVHNRDDQEGGG